MTNIFVIFVIFVPDDEAEFTDYWQEEDLTKLLGVADTLDNALIFCMNDNYEDQKYSLDSIGKQGSDDLILIETAHPERPLYRIKKVEIFKG